MLSDEQIRTIGDAILLGVLTEPFFHVGTDALMNREYRKAGASYLLGAIPAICALIVLGIISIGPLTTLAIRQWLHPVVTNPYIWLALWFVLLCWLGGPQFVQKMRTAWRKGGFRPWLVYDHFADEHNQSNGFVYTHLWFRNEPTGGAAWDVVGRITWTPKNRDQVLAAGNGKWQEVPWNLGRAIYAANHIDFANDGKPHALDLCVRKPPAFEFCWLDVESSRRGAIAQTGYYSRGFMMSTWSFLATGTLRTFGLRCR